MQESLLRSLRCPVTRSALSMTILKEGEKMLDGEKKSIIEEAVLYASEDWYYPVIKGIPRLNVEAFLDYADFFKAHRVDHEKLKDDLLKKYGELVKQVVRKNKRTKESFKKEWSVYNYDKDKTWDADNEAMMQRFLTETDETKNSLKGKLIFDAGCGNGKLDLLIADHGATVVAMDLTDGFEQAYLRNRSSNVHFIQGDVQYPPVAFDLFDIVHCSGVLIHTNNAELSFSRIEPAVKTNGKLSVWLYHPVKDWIHNLFNAIRKVTSKLPLGFQYYLYLVTIFPVSYVIKRLKGNKQNRREMMVDILDWFTPEFRSEHKHSEVGSWFSKRNYKNIRITTTNKFGFNMTGNKTP
jgi:2-polyprenyl-3-methyl-5-hydroxy-6-metoxy-1,4-benzoquinol methylase/uncharacterized protein YbaR (Trm112 family)